jgi:transposase
MKDTLSIETERMDGLPLLIMQMHHMHVAALLDQHIPTHGHRKGVSVGELCMVWLAHILSQADHRMNRVQEWGKHRMETLRGCGIPSLSEADLTDDRLADVLRLLSHDEHWRSFEQDLMGQVVRVYEQSATCVRIDTTTASSYAEVNEQGLLTLGHSKDHRPDLPQLKLALASLDPLGMPLATEVVSGEKADDPLYLPLIARVRSGLQKTELLDVGDCKMAALPTRASLATQGAFYLCPLSALQASPEQIREEVSHLRAQGAPLIEVSRENDEEQPTRIAQGYETVETVTAEVNGVLHTWQERRLLVQSLAAAHAAEKNVQERIKKAQQALETLTARRQGKARLTERTQVEEGITAILGEFRVQGLLHVLISEHERVQPVRAYRGRLREERREITFTLIVTRDEEAITEALSHLS